jgi:hypothetical protein
MKPTTKDWLNLAEDDLLAVKSSFIAAGIIGSDGNLKDPYKKISLPEN